MGTRIHIILSGFDLMTCLHDVQSIRFYEQVQHVLTRASTSEYDEICFLHRNMTRYISDVWLTVHRNSVWIRKTN